MSGPVVHDKLWYSAAYNPRIDRIEKDIPGHGSFTDSRTAHVFAAASFGNLARAVPNGSSARTGAFTNRSR